jgi:HEAT repeat protein
VEDRLGQLRAEYERRQIDVANPGASKREVPTAAASTKHMMERDEVAMEAGDELEDEQELAELRETLFNDPDPEERIGAILMLTGEEGPSSMAMLVEAMGDPDAEVRLAVVEALGDRSEELSPGTLAGPLADPDPEVRFEAVSILGDLEDPEAQAMVKAALNDPDEDVRALAEGILDFSEDDDEPTNAQRAQPGM